MRSQLDIIGGANVIILLDACRFDVFKRVYDRRGLSHPLEEVKSPTSQTRVAVVEDIYRRGFPETFPENEYKSLANWERGAAGSNIIYWRK